MKVLLIQPPFTIFKTEVRTCHTPLGLAYLAAMLKKDHDVLIMDTLAEGYGKEEIVSNEFIKYGLPFEDIKKRIKEIMPDVVGISCLFSAQSRNVLKICALAKEADKKIITVLGGAHPSTVPEEVLRDKNVDFVVIGEGEETLSRLLQDIEQKRVFLDKQAYNIAFRYNDQIKVSGKRKYNDNLDNLPFPYWRIFPLEKYYKINIPHGGSVKNSPFLPMITSRGCPFECIFCSLHNIWGRNYRKRTADNVMAELDYLIREYGVKEILFEDDNLTLDKARAKDIFSRMIERNLNIGWSSPNGIAVQTLDDEMLELMKASGCHSISIGIESGDEYVLKNIVRKPITLKMVNAVVKKAKRLGLDVTVFFVVGFPGETRAHINNTFRFAERLNVDSANFFFATPLPGTRLLDLCREKELVSGNFDYMRLKPDFPVFSTDIFSINKLNFIVSRRSS